MKGIVNALLMHYKREKEFNEKKIQFYLKKKGEIIGKNRENKKEFIDKNVTMSGFLFENSRDFIRDFAMSVHGFILFFIGFFVNFFNKIGKIDVFFDENAGSYIQNNKFIKNMLIISIFLIGLCFISISVRLLAKIVIF